jgi:hypothetical protein
MKREAAPATENVVVDNVASEPTAQTRANHGPEGASDAEAIPDAVLDAVDRSRAHERHAAPRSAFGNLALAFVSHVDGDAIDVSIGGKIVEAKASPTLHAAVLKTAQRTGEPVLVERNTDGSIVVVGGLRTRPTPGVDETKEITLEADRIHLKGRKEILLSTEGAASIALRAVGEIETYANRIVSRAEELHKIVGRMLRLN